MEGARIQSPGPTKINVMLMKDLFPGIDTLNVGDKGTMLINGRVVRDREVENGRRLKTIQFKRPERKSKRIT